MTVALMRAGVLARDGLRCVAPALDPDAGPCFDRWGEPLPMPAREDQLEIDYVRLGARAPHHWDLRDHVTLCPGHHRGAGPSAGRQWGPAHRQLERSYLDEKHEGDHGD